MRKLPLLSVSFLLSTLLTGCPEPEPGPDAGKPADGGEPADAGDPDAGSDAGDPDGGAPDAGDPDGGAPDAGDPDAGDPGDGGAPGDGGDPDAGPVTYENESCNTAAPLVPGQQVSASNERTHNDHNGSCAFGGGADLVYTLELQEPSGLRLRAAGYNIVLYLTQNGCDAEHEVPGGCSDVPGDSEELAFSLLEAGTYQVIVDTYSDFFGGGHGGAFTLDAEVFPGGLCLPDAYDAAAPNESAQAATAVGGTDLATEELIACEGDTDYYLVEHMGGSLGVTAGLVAGAGSLSVELYAASGTVNELGDIAVTEGAKIADAPHAAPLDRGLYLVKASSSGAAGDGDRYSLALSHGCQADEGDRALAELDDADVAHAVLTLTESDTAPLSRRLCDGDTDTVLVQVGSLTDLTLAIGRSDVLTTTLEQVIVVDGVRTTTAYAPGYTSSDVNGELQLSLTSVPPGTELLLTTRASATIVDEIAYEVTPSFTVHAPTNDTCGSAQAVYVGEDSQPFIGSTRGGTHTFQSECNYDYPDQGSPEVFYTFNLPERMDFEIRFEGSPYDKDNPFVVGLSLWNYPGYCPMDLSELVPVEVPDPFSMTNIPLCEFGDNFRVRLPQLPLGDYLLIVDGENLFVGGGTEGAFRLQLKSYPQGYPTPLACTEATEQALPASGESVSFLVDTRPGQNDLFGGDYPCLGYGADGNERAIRLAPTEDVTVRIETTPGFDTAIVLREGDCGFGDEVFYEDEFGGLLPACSDDSIYGIQSEIDGVPLRAGTVYYLIVDGSYGESGTTTVTITAQ